MGKFTINDETIDNYWLVVLTILKNMSSSMGRIIPYIMGNKKCLKPPTSIFGGTVGTFRCHAP